MYVLETGERRDVAGVPVVVMVTTRVGSLSAPVDDLLSRRKLYTALRDTVFHVYLVVSAGCGSPSGTHCPTVLYSMRYSCTSTNVYVGGCQAI